MSEVTKQNNSVLELSKQIISDLNTIIEKENNLLSGWAAKNYVADRIAPSLSKGRNIHCNIAVAAPVSAGKSTLFNALCGYPILPVASKTTSSVPTYINRVEERKQECVTVYGIKKEEIDRDGIKYTRFVRDDKTKRTYYADDISVKMFNELFEYMYYVMHGENIGGKINYKTTVENAAHFMTDKAKAYTVFYGDDADKWTINKEDYALNYNNPRHRFLLLLILLCVYVDQNENAAKMDQYTKTLNNKRKKLFENYKLPVNSDYCVYLDWCNDDLPENVTLIDLPGTGAATRDTENQSSHTELVRGILTDADAVWVLCSDNGTVDSDLLNALEDIIVGNSRKNKVCIYNCKNNNPNDSGPVKDFLDKLPCLTGERCYVVDALAGEYKYVQNGIDILMTKNASTKRKADYDWPDEIKFTNIIEKKYNNEIAANCTFTTGRDSANNIIVVQDAGVKYTLKTFFERALTDYVGRLKYEVALEKAIEQLGFYSKVSGSLVSSRAILDSLQGKDAIITEAVIEALKKAKEDASNKYIGAAIKCQDALQAELIPLSETLNETIKNKFQACLANLINDLKKEWITLERKGHPNCLVPNILGNYSLGKDHPNWKKFDRVRKSSEKKITMEVFESALKVSDDEMKKFEGLLNEYIDSLKGVTQNFKNDYINAFVTAFDKERDKYCGEDINGVKIQIYDNFNKTREDLKKALEPELNGLCEMLCKSFNELTDNNGIFDKICKETADEFRSAYSQRVLDTIRKHMRDKYSGTNTQLWIFNYLRPGDLNRLLQADFTEQKNEYTDVLKKLVNSFYGMNLGDKKNHTNFSIDLDDKVRQFNNDIILDKATSKIDASHKTVSALVGFGTRNAVESTSQIKDVDSAIEEWKKLSDYYKEIYSKLIDSEVENTKKLYNDCKNQIERIITSSKK